MIDVDSNSTPVGSYIEWSAVVAGMITALAVSFVLLTFGAAVGLSAVSPWTSSIATAVSVSMGAVFWMLLSYVWAFSLGGYLSGRMRHRWSSVKSEVEFRDGTHGLLVWASAITLAAVVATLGFAGHDRNGLSPASDREPLASVIDTLLRPVRSGPDIRTDDVRAQASRLLTHSQPVTATTSQAATASRAQLVQLVSTHTGLSEPDADKRIAESVTELKLIADRARKLAILIGFLTAASLLIAGAAAWVSAEIWWAASRRRNAVGCFFADQVNRILKCVMLFFGSLAFQLL
jgi:hypothetical protein